MHYVYILQLDDGSYYTGYTANIEEWLAQHARGTTFSTQKSKTLQVTFFAAFPDKMKALAFEKYLKSSSGYAFRKKHFL